MNAPSTPTSASTSRMTTFEKRVAASIGLVMSVRMLGLFMILPVFTLFAHSYLHVTEQRIGLAIGIYGLTQAIFQIPFGIASDIWGRKRVIVLGLTIFLLGSVIAALSESIFALIIGRALQGAGAIGSVLMALMADLTRPQHRTKAMAILGMGIGASFSLALFLGSFSAQWLDLSGLFWLTALMAVSAMLMVWKIIPSQAQYAAESTIDNEQITPQQPIAWSARLMEILKNPELFKLNISIFFLHIMLTALFVGMPVVLQALVNRGLINYAWEIYLPVLLASLIATAPMIIIAERYQQLKMALVVTVMIIVASFLVLWEHNATVLGCFIGLWLFFTAFNSLEALLPSLVSRIAPKQSKGTAMSFYACAQFLGIFVGGSLGGWFYSFSYLNDIFLCLAAMATIWLAIVFNMESPRIFNQYALSLAPEHLLDAAYLHKKLNQLPGVQAIQVDIAAGVAHLTIDPNFFDARQAQLFQVNEG